MSGKDSKETTALAPVTEGDERRDALMRALGFDRLQPAMAELALAIATRYDLDPMLRHIVMVDGKPYITRDGLLHVAWKSGVFDGIEVDRPVLDEDGKYWRTEARVYRKDIQRPFRYPGRYPATGGNARYNEEMCIKVAEVMTLRRAFDVSAPVVEEQWDGEIPSGETPVQTGSLAERIQQRALAAGNSEEQPVADASDASASNVVVDQASPAVAEGEPLAATLVQVNDDGTADVEGDEGELLDAMLAEAVVAEAQEEGDDDDEPEPESEPAPVVSPLRQPVTNDGPTLDEFKEWAKGKDTTLIRNTAAELFPNATGFSQLNPKELGVIQHEYGKAVAKREESASAERCAAPSPLSSNRCTLDPGHKGQHRHGTRETWD